MSAAAAALAACLLLPVLVIAAAMGGGVGDQPSSTALADIPPVEGGSRYGQWTWALYEHFECVNLIER